MGVQAYTLTAGNVLREAVAALSAPVATWAAAWGLPAPVLRAERACDAVPAPAARWSGRHAGGRTLWFACHAEWQTELQRMLFAPDGSLGPQEPLVPRLASAAAGQAAEALERALALCLLGADAAALDRVPDNTVLARGSGAIVIYLQLGRLEGRVLLDAACVQALCPQPAPVLPALARVDRYAALAATPLALRLTVGAARVGLASLMSLEAGDVIRLDRAIDAPATLALPSGDTVFRAYLGRIGDSIAVELAGLN